MLGPNDSEISRHNVEERILMMVLLIEWAVIGHDEATCRSH
jgi:hypothetical protein